MRILGTGLARTAAILGPLALAAAGAVADEATPLRVNGEIASVKDRQVTVQTRDGKAVRVDLAADAKVMAMAPGRAEVPGREVGRGCRCRRRSRTAG